MICECGHEAFEHDPPPEDDPEAYGPCAACECDEFVELKYTPRDEL